VGASYSNDHVVRPSVCPSVYLSHANISETKQDRGIVARKLEQKSGLPNSESFTAIESTFPPFWVFPGWYFARSDRNGAVSQLGPMNGSVGTAASLNIRPALSVSLCTSCASSYVQLH